MTACIADQVSLIVAPQGDEQLGLTCSKVMSAKDVRSGAFTRANCIENLLITWQLIMRRNVGIMTIRHVVIVKFNEEVSSEDTETSLKAFDALADELDIVLAYERGLQNSKEGLDGGFTHVFLLDFKDEQARDQYVVHPSHKKFVEENLVPNVERVMVVDYPIAYHAKK